MDILLDCPHCDGRAAFRPRRLGLRGARLIGRCGTCRSVFRLSGGRLADVELGPGLAHLVPSARAAFTRDRDADPTIDVAARAAPG